MSEEIEKGAPQATPGQLLKPGQPGFDAKDQKEYAKRMKVIPGLRERGDAHDWKLGDHYAAIRDQKLFRQAGCSSFSEWLRVRDIGRTKAYALIDFASTFSLAQVRRHGGDKLWLVLDYMTLTAREEQEWAPEALVIYVPEGDGLRRVKFQEATVADLEAALTHQRALAQRRAIERLPADQKELASALAEAAGPEARLTLRARDPDRPQETRVTIETNVAVLPGVLERILVRSKSQRRPGGR